MAKSLRRNAESLTPNALRLMLKAEGLKRGILFSDGFDEVD